MNNRGGQGQQANGKSKTVQVDYHNAAEHHRESLFADLSGEAFLKPMVDSSRPLL